MNYCGRCFIFFDSHSDLMTYIMTMTIELKPSLIVATSTSVTALTESSHLSALVLAP